jgi:hypothetical protein
MVEDIDVAHARWSQHGLGPSKITRGRIHDRFTILDPAGALGQRVDRCDLLLHTSPTT